MRRLLIALVLALAPVSSFADEPCGPRDGPDWKPRKGTTPVWFAGLSGTSGIMASAGLVIGSKPPRCARCALGSGTSGLLLQLGAGTDAARVSAGIAAVLPFLGVGGKLALERAWRDKHGVGRGSMSFGPELQVQVVPVSVSSGLLWRVGGPGGRRVRWSWAAGIGF